jgi:hypothetical protein
LLKELEERLEEFDLVENFNTSIELFPVLSKVLDVTLQERVLCLLQCAVNPCELIVDLLVLSSVAAEFLLELEDGPDVCFLEAASVLVRAVASYEGHVEVLLSHEEQYILDAVSHLELVTSKIVSIVPLHFQ